ncbi:unnamed protein product [Caenorhabditis angaria]|uniref:7TM GPCR serpentine receptor class x (Srx) domain-containing protein n=1 Tax=Caenorhabditis angaria TaxID=860376 RepID=A0A9P1IUX2_9PELO|nr:unnamed protein product [Caenorhabditis angaria]
MDLFAAFLITSNSIFGIYCNFQVFNNYRKNKKERTSFNMICFFRSFINIHILSTTFIAVFVPATIFGYSIYNSAIESSIISLSMTLYFANDYGAILISLNRLFALYHPMTYSKVFGMKPTFITLLVIHILQVGMIIQELLEYIHFSFEKLEILMADASFLACSTLFVVFLFGIYTNFHVIRFLLIGNIEKTSFNVICVSKAFFNAFLVTIGLSLSFFNILLDKSPLPPMGDNIIVMIGVNFTICNNVFNVLTALNRFGAVYFTKYYDIYLNSRKTGYIIFVVILIAIIVTVNDVMDYSTLDCYFHFNTTSFLWLFTEDCFKVSYLFYEYEVMYGLIIISNIFCFIQLYKLYNQKNFKNQKLRRNLYLLIQTSCQDSFGIMSIIVSFKLMLLYDSVPWKFFSGTVAWAIFHGIDGLIMMIFTKKLMKNMENSTISNSQTNTVQVLPMKY